MEEWREKGERLERHLRPATFPVAVRLLVPGEEPPERSRRPLDEAGCPIALCQGLTLTRERGLTMAFGLQDCSCPLANAAYGWDDSIDPSFMTTFLQLMNYASGVDTAAKKMEDMFRLENGAYPSLVLSPLTRTRIEPHTVLVYGNPAQIMRLVQAASRWTGETVRAGFGGIAGSCNEAILGSFTTGSPRVALPGNGDRVFAATQDHEIIFAFPASWMDRILEGLDTTSERGVRYPIPTFMNYRLPFTDLMERFGG